jgi:hypothetical protein
MGWSVLCLVITGCGTGQPGIETAEQATPSAARRIETAQGKYRAVITLRPYQPEVDAGLWFGGSESTPTEVVQRVDVWFDGEAVAIGRGCYADLSSVTEASIYLLTDGAELRIKGGDAADSYTAYLRFRKGELVSRRVEDGEFPENFFEGTHFVNTEPKY